MSLPWLSLASYQRGGDFPSDWDRDGRHLPPLVLVVKVRGRLTGPRYEDVSDLLRRRSLPDHHPAHKHTQLRRRGRRTRIPLC